MDEMIRKTLYSLFDQSCEEVQNGKYEEALNIIDKCLSSPHLTHNSKEKSTFLSAKIKVLSRMAEKAKKNNNLEEFMLHTEAMLVADPKCKEAWELRVQAFNFQFKANKSNDAFEAAIQAAQLGSTKVPILVLAGDRYMVRSDYQNALGTFERALELEHFEEKKDIIFKKIEHAKEMQATHDKLLEGEKKEKDVGACSSKDVETHIGELEKISTSEVFGEIVDDDILLPPSSSKILDEDITKSDSHSKSPFEYVEFAVGVRFSISKVDKHGLYDGFIYRVDGCNLQSEVSFITFKDSGYAFEASKALLPFNSRHENILRFEQLLDAKCIPNIEGEQKILVVERVMHLDHFFEVKCQQFYEQNPTGHESDRMKFINEDLKRIFCDVVHGMIFLIGKDKWLGDFDNGIYVTPDGRGKIIPFAHNWKRVGNDIDDLRLKIEKIIRGDFPSFDIESIDDVFQLPIDLRSFLTSLSSSYLKEIDPRWLLDSPYFWSRKEKVKFFEKLRFEFRKKTISAKALEQYMESICENGAKKIVDGEVSWSCVLPERSVYKMIYDRPKQATSHASKNAPFRLQIDIVRFAIAVYTHHNDDEYKGFRARMLEKIEIEEQQSTFFPRMYTLVVQALMSYTSLLTLSKKVKNKILLNLLSCADV